MKTEKVDNGEDGRDTEDNVVPDDDTDTPSLPGKHNSGADITVPKKHNPTALSVYGQISIGVWRHQTALYVSSHFITPNDHTQFSLQIICSRHMIMHQKIL